MADYVWPDDLVPYAIDFYLDPHTGGSESPFSLKTKIYGLSAPRWVCSLSLRGGHWGTRDLEAIGPRVDALLDKLEGRLNRIQIYDFKRWRPRSQSWPRNASNLAAALGATQMTITGLPVGTTVYAGDYVGGDGRPHRILDDVKANSSGQAVVTFKPPLRAAVGAGNAIFHKVTGMFRRTDDSGSNPAVVGEAQDITIEFVEDL